MKVGVVGVGSVTAAWGLAFKARTDDIRESPSIFCVDKFIEAGISVKACDPEAVQTAQAHFGDKVTFCPDYYDTLEGTDTNSD